MAHEHMHEHDEECEFVAVVEADSYVGVEDVLGPGSGIAFAYLDVISVTAMAMRAEHDNDASTGDMHEKASEALTRGVAAYKAVDFDGVIEAAVAVMRWQGAQFEIAHPDKRLLLADRFVSVMGAMMVIVDRAIEEIVIEGGEPR